MTASTSHLRKALRAALKDAGRVARKHLPELRDSTREVIETEVPRVVETVRREAPRAVDAVMAELPRVAEAIRRELRARR